MTIPTFEGGGIPEKIPVIPESPSIRFHSPNELQALRQLANAIFIFPRGMLHSSFNRLPVPKALLHHQVVTQLIAKFNPSLAQFAVLSHKLQPVEKLDKPEQLPPKETSTQRDETTAKGLGHDLVNIEVFQAEKGESHQGDQGSSLANGKEQPEIKLKEEEFDVPLQEGKLEPQEEKLEPQEEKPELEVPPKAEKSHVEPKEVKTEMEPKEVQPPAEKEAPISEKQGKKVEVPQAQKPAKDEKVEDKSRSNEVVKSEGQPEKTAPNAQTMAPQKETMPESPEKPHLEANKVSPVENQPEEKKISVHTEKEIHKEEQQPIHKEKAAIAHQQLSGRSEETAQAPQHRIFHSVDDPSMIVPPWLSMLLPNLTEAELFVNKSGKGGKAVEVQHPHKISDILFMLLCANLSGMHTLREAIPFIEKRENWFKVILGLQHGLPPRQLIFWFLATLDATVFEKTLKLWLQEVQGLQSGSPILVDVIILQTALGFIMGKLQGSKGNPEAPSKLVEGFSLKNFVAMVKSEGSYGFLLEKIRQRGAEYIAEVDEELHPADNSQRYESYVEGIERTVMEEWMPPNSSTTNLSVHSEFFSAQGVSKSDRFYVSSLKSPNEDFFDLSRLQKPYENKLFWLINNSLRFPSIGNAFQRCNASLQNIEQYAKEMILIHGDVKNSIEQQMQKASKDLDFLLQLTRLN